MMHRSYRLHHLPLHENKDEWMRRWNETISEEVAIKRVFRTILIFVFISKSLQLVIPFQAEKKWKNACKHLKHFDCLWMLIVVPDCHPKRSRKMRSENNHFLYCLKLLTVYALHIVGRCYTYFLYTFLPHSREPRLAL